MPEEDLVGLCPGEYTIIIIITTIIKKNNNNNNNLIYKAP